MARAKNPDLPMALACARQVIGQTAGASTVVTAVGELITEMYDLDYPGIPDIIDKVLTGELHADKAVKVITAMKAMYDRGGDDEEGRGL